MIEYLVYIIYHHSHLIGRARISIRVSKWTTNNCQQLFGDSFQVDIRTVCQRYNVGLYKTLLPWQRHSRLSAQWRHQQFVLTGAQEGHVHNL